jgi:PPM family protein phosphatase
MIEPLQNGSTNSSTNYYTQSFTLQGKRAYQEDSFLISKKADSCLVIVADGLGGHGHGDFASQLCCSIFNKEFNKPDFAEGAQKFLEQTSLLVNRALISKGEYEPEYERCGTTVTGFYVLNRDFYVLNVGDSRVYGYYKNQELRRLTRDHSVVQEMVDRKIITEEEAFVHPNRNIVTSSLGVHDDYLDISVTGPHELKQDMVLLAFSDGVHDGLIDDQLLSLMRKNTSGLAKALVEAALEAGSRDNITACLLSLNSNYAE